MKTAKMFVVAIVLSLAGVVYATGDAQHAHDNSKVEKKAACCLMKAGGQDSKSDCSKDGATCCKDGNCCSAQDGNCCGEGKCAGKDGSCCTAEAKGGAKDMACCKKDGNSSGCCGDACQKAKAGKK